MKKQSIGSPIVVEILPEDMKDADFDDIYKCPLAKAIRRMFNSEDVRVGSTDIWGPHKSLFSILSESIDPNITVSGFFYPDFKEVQLKLTQDPNYIHKLTIHQYYNEV